MLESQFEKIVCSCIKSYGGKAYKFVSPGNPGVPDRLCVLPGGIIIFIEVKRPGLNDGLSIRQKKVIQTLEDFGCVVWRISEKQELIARLEAIF